uniref:BZIP domain-containing protein n=1 Tax=Kalanchoe fedtschenkoi TaxID=63787 RepID=A0A7N0ZVR8_KALFE
MGTNLNFNHFGGEAAAAGGGRQVGNSPLTRQTSIYALTFDELQNTMGGSIGKDFGSMNMDELLKNIWTAEESQTMAAAAAAAGGGAIGGGVGSSGGCNLQRQGSLTLPRTLSQKTVDEIWKDMSKDGGGGGAGGGASGAGFAQRQPTLGEITLEEFLVRAGVVREDANIAQNLASNGTTNGVGGFYGDLIRNNNGRGVTSDALGGFGFQQAGLVNSCSQMMMQPANLPLNINGVRSSDQQPQKHTHQQPLFPKQPALSYANPLGGSPRLRGGLVGLADPGLIQGGGLGMTGLGVTVATGSPAQLSSDGLGRSNGDTSSLSPVPYAFSAGIRGRRVNGAVEKVVERRQRRMIKNRESAARSRARKQAYTMELEAEVAKLKEENQELQKKQAEIMEMQKNQVLEMMNNQGGGGKRQCLRRTQTGPW